VDQLSSFDSVKMLLKLFLFPSPHSPPPVLRIELRASQMLGKHCTTELHPLLLELSFSTKHFKETDKPKKISAEFSQMTTNPSYLHAPWRCHSFISVAPFPKETTYPLPFCCLSASKYTDLLGPLWATGHCRHAGKGLLWVELCSLKLIH
jgi:hypothetical protein